MFLFFCLLAFLMFRGVVGKIQANATATAQAAEVSPQLSPLDDSALAKRVASMEANVARNPQDARARVELGFLYLETDAVDEAHDQLWKAVELRPEDETIYLDVGHYFMEDGQPASAAEVLVIGLEELPDSQLLRISLGEALWKLGGTDQDSELAEELLRRLVEAAPSDPLFHTYLARTLIIQGRMEEAREEIDLVLESAPRLGEAHLVNAVWLRRDDQFLAARRELQVAVELEVNEKWLRLEIEREFGGIEGGADADG